MTKLIILAAVILIVIALAAAIAAKIKGQGSGKSDVYYLRKAIFTPAERSFLGVLDSLVDQDIRVFGKVRLEDIFGVQKGLDRAARTAARNRINRKHVDFLLVRASDLTPICGIELDDSSHEEDDRKERDQFVDAVFASGGIPLLHFTAAKAYNPTDVAAKISAALEGALRLA